MKKSESLVNHFLIAMPTLADTNFAKAVVYIYEHNEEGVTGLVINKPLQVTLGSVLRHLDIKVEDDSIETQPVFMGGPIGQDHGFVIFRKEPTKAKSTKKNAETSVMISSSKDTLKEIAEGMGPKNFLITLGFAGWQDGQLELEISRNDWLIAPPSEELLFKTPIDKRWNKAANLIGIDINHLSLLVGHA